jgi:prevent-host-death family protein
MKERFVGAREANQQFSALLAAAERDGITVVITRRGRVIARLVPESDKSKDDEAADAAIASMLARYARPMGGQPFLRDEIYDRGELGR